MASSYTIFLNSKLVDKPEKIKCVRSFYLRTADLAFGKSKMNCPADFEDYGYRSLSNYEKLTQLWIELTNESDGGARKITQIIQGFAVMMKEALDSKYIFIDIEYDIKMYFPKHKTDSQTECILVQPCSDNVESRVHIDINVKKVTSIKTLFECLIHDIAHATASIFIKFKADLAIILVGEFDEEYDEGWIQAAFFLMDSFCRQPLAETIDDHVKDVPEDVRGELDITMKVCLKQI